MERVIEPEWLDVLPADDPRARRSRGDLRRINWFMNNAGLVANALAPFPKSKCVLDIGAGDGAFAFKLVKKCGWSNTQVMLVDQNGEVSPSVREDLEKMNCKVEYHRIDALAGLEAVGEVDVAFVNLFLHHFDDARLKHLLTDIASRCDIFVACESRRSAFALLGSRCVALLGCNDVTQHDAVVSVRAGFDGDELSRLWPASAGWSLSERSAGLFSHLFVARRL